MDYDTWKTTDTTEPDVVECPECKGLGFTPGPWWGQWWVICKCCDGTGLTTSDQAAKMLKDHTEE